MEYQKWDAKLWAVAAVYTLELGTQLQYFDRQQIPPTSAKTEEKGFIPGVYFGYSLTNQPIFLNSQVSYHASNVASSGYSVLQFQAAAGYSLLRNELMDLGVYVGVGLRNFERQFDRGSGQSPFGSSSLNKTALFTLFAPVGIRGTLFLSDRFHLGLEGSMGIPFATRLTVNLPGARSGSPSVSAFRWIGTSFFWKLQAPATYWVHPSFGITLNPFVETLGFEMGEVATQKKNLTYTEPAHQMIQFGTQVKAALRF